MSVNPHLVRIAHGGKLKFVNITGVADDTTLELKPTTTAFRWRLLYIGVWDDDATSRTVTGQVTDGTNFIDMGIAAVTVAGTAVSNATAFATPSQLQDAYIDAENYIIITWSALTATKKGNLIALVMETPRGLTA